MTWQGICSVLRLVLSVSRQSGPNDAKLLPRQATIERILKFDAVRPEQEWEKNETMNKVTLTRKEN